MARTIILVAALGCLTLSFGHAQEPPRSRLLVTTDIGGDPDEMQSLIRLMLYTNEFIMEGFVASASGTPGELGREEVRPDLIRKIILAYGEVYPNLKSHDHTYPSPDSLLAVVKEGNPQRGMSHIGKGHATEGSEWIIRKVDESDQLLNVAVWG